MASQIKNAAIQHPGIIARTNKKNKHSPDERDLKRNKSIDKSQETKNNGKYKKVHLFALPTLKVLTTFQHFWSSNQSLRKNK